MADIDIGPACSDRGSTITFNYTLIALDNPANAAGTITKVFIWPVANITGAEVATFYKTNATIFSTRDTESIPGTIIAGAAREYAVSLSVEIGDYIGIYFTSGDLERDTVGFAGLWYKVGDYIPCTTETFSAMAGDSFSLYGEGDIAAEEAEPTIFFSHNF